MCRTIIYKLLAFTFAMITFPIASYFLSVNTIFGGLSCPSIPFIHLPTYVKTRGISSTTHPLDHPHSPSRHNAPLPTHNP